MPPIFSQLKKKKRADCENIIYLDGTKIYPPFQGALFDQVPVEFLGVVNYDKCGMFPSNR